jgi:hypothetical protein
MRTGYASAKIGAFCGLALARGLLDFPSGVAWRAGAPGLVVLSTALAWVAALLCVLRGVPVIAQGFRQLGRDAGVSGAA